MHRLSGTDRGSPAQRALIIHADDLGMCHSVNQATFEAFKDGAVTSSSVMAPCPWLPEVSTFAESHPEADVGLHLTLTSECSAYRWRPLSSTANQEGLVDSAGFFPDDVEHLRCFALDIRDEVRSQVYALEACGIKPTHIDSHMMAAFCSSRMIKNYAQAVGDAKTMAFVPPRARGEAIRYMPSLDRMIPSLQAIHIKPTSSPHLWFDFYRSAIDNLAEGVSILIVHLGFDNDELRAIRGAKVGWDAEWRQRDFDVLTSARFKRHLNANDIQLINWRDLRPPDTLADGKGEEG